MYFLQPNGTRVTISEGQRSYRGTIVDQNMYGIDFCLVKLDERHPNWHLAFKYALMGDSSAILPEHLRDIDNLYWLNIRMLTEEDEYEVDQ